MENKKHKNTKNIWFRDVSARHSKPWAKEVVVSRTLKFNPLNFLFLKQDSENEDLKHMPHYITYQNIDTQCMSDLRTFG